MKRILYYLLIAAGALTLHACDLMEDRAYDRSPDERLQKALDEYAEALTSAPNGWLMTIDTGKKGGFQLYMSFTDRERVVMLCDIDANYDVGAATSAVPCESAYQLKALQMPSLLFSTYNYIHLMADPQDWGHGGGNGAGLDSDFEFDILSYDSNVFTLRGTYNKCMAYLRQATPEEARAVMDGGLKTGFEQLAAYNATAKYPIITLGERKVQLTLNGREADLQWVDDAKQVQELSGHTWTEVVTGDAAAPEIHLFTPLEIEGRTLTGFVWNGEHYDAVDTEGNVYTGTDNLTPILPLRLGEGELYTKLTFTTPTAFAGTVSQAYLDTYYTPAEELYTAWGRKINRIVCQFVTNADGKKVFRVYAYSQTPPAATEYQAGWDIDYTINDDGTYTFSNREAGGDGGNITNARNYGQKMRGMLDIFSKVTYSSYKYTNSTNFDIVVESVEPHTFRLEWMPSSTPGLAGPLGAFVSIDDPGMYFCGTLSN